MNIGFVVFPGITQLDFTGPAQVLSRAPGASIHVIARAPGPVATDCGFAIMPTTTFAQAPDLDILCVPGGAGVRDVLTDPETVRYVADAAAPTQWMTSVCTGAFVLGIAGLLAGRRATTHWAYRPLLKRVGATPQDARVVRDDNVITGAGVTAGIDFALVLIAEAFGASEAQQIQLALEYDPAPPFTGGTPNTAPAHIRDALSGRYASRVRDFGRLLGGP